MVTPAGCFCLVSRSLPYLMYACTPSGSRGHVTNNLICESGSAPSPAGNCNMPTSSDLHKCHEHMGSCASCVRCPRCARSIEQHHRLSASSLRDLAGPEVLTAQRLCKSTMLAPFVKYRNFQCL
jgi:hypothetical protein